MTLVAADQIISNHKTEFIKYVFLIEESNKIHYLKTLMEDCTCVSR